MLCKNIKENALPDFLGRVLETVKNHSARKETAFSSLPLEGKVPSAHTGRMRWKSCNFLTEVSAFSKFLLATSSVSLRLPASPRGEAFDQLNPLVQRVKQTFLTN